MAIGFILLLIVVNGIFAMSEMSLVSSKTTRLRKLAEERRAGARSALKLHEEPARFLSTAQVGITSVAILSGALGEEAITAPLLRHIERYPPLVPYADAIALVLTVALITYFSVVIGELVPKRLALLRPERIAVIVARPMQILAIAATPLVWLLTASSNVLLRMMGAYRAKQQAVTNEEIRLLMEIGSEAGVFHADEGPLVANVLRLDERRVGSIMVPCNAIYIVDLTEDATAVRHKIADCPYAKAVVCRNGLDNVLGFLQRGDLLQGLMSGAGFDVESNLRPALYIPNSISLIHLLEFFRSHRADFALIVNEYGEIDGLATLRDVLTAIVGDLPRAENEIDADIVQRSDGSWLVDGGLSLPRLKVAVDMQERLPGEANNAYNTLGGFIMYYLEKIPRVGECFQCRGWYFEVVDLDGVKIDKVLIKAPPAQP